MYLMALNVYILYSVRLMKTVVGPSALFSKPRVRRNAVNKSSKVAGLKVCPALSHLLPFTYGLAQHFPADYVPVIIRHGQQAAAS